MDFIRDNAIAIISGAVFLVLSFNTLWITNQLSPILKDLALLTTRVQATESNVSNSASTESVRNIETRLDRIETKLDRLIERK